MCIQVIQPYLKVFYLLLGRGVKASEHRRFFILGYQLLPLATSKLMSDNNKFEDLALFKVFNSLLEQKNFRTLKIHHWWSWVSNCCP